MILHNTAAPINWISAQRQIYCWWLICLMLLYQWMHGRQRWSTVCQSSWWKGYNWEGKTVAASGGLMVEVGAVYKKTSHKISVGGWHQGWRLLLPIRSQTLTLPVCHRLEGYLSGKVKRTAALMPLKASQPPLKWPKDIWEFVVCFLQFYSQTQNTKTATLQTNLEVSKWDFTKTILPPAF